MKTARLISLFVSAQAAAAALYALPLTMTEIYSTSENINTVPVVGRLENDPTQRSATATLGLFFEDTGMPGMTVKITLLVNGTYSTLHQDRHRIYRNGSFAVEAYEDIVRKGSKTIRRTLREVEIYPGGIAVSNGTKNHEFGLLVVSPAIPGVKDRRSYQFVGRYQLLLQGDIDENGDVELEDLNAVRNNFGATGNAQIGDANLDGVVNLEDLNIVRNQFGRNAP